MMVRQHHNNNHDTDRRSLATMIRRVSVYVYWGVIDLGEGRGRNSLPARTSRIVDETDQAGLTTDQIQSQVSHLHLHLAITPTTIIPNLAIIPDLPITEVGEAMEEAMVVKGATTNKYPPQLKEHYQPSPL